MQSSELRKGLESAISLLSHINRQLFVEPRFGVAREMIRQTRSYLHETQKEYLGSFAASDPSYKELSADGIREYVEMVELAVKRFDEFALAYACNDCLTARQEQDYLDMYASLPFAPTSAAQHSATAALVQARKSLCTYLHEPVIRHFSLDQIETILDYEMEAMNGQP